MFHLGGSALGKVAGTEKGLAGFARRSGSPAGKAAAPKMLLTPSKPPGRLLKTFPESGGGATGGATGRRSGRPLRELGKAAPAVVNVGNPTRALNFSW